MADKNNENSKGVLNHQQRMDYGAQWFEYIMHAPAPKAADGCAYYEAIPKFVFAEMWSRPALDRRSRRLITLACVGAADTAVPIQTHIYAALKSGDLSLEEMNEFVLHFAIYLGWPKASIMQQVVHEMWEKVVVEGGVEALPVPQIPEET